MTDQDLSSAFAKPSRAAGLQPPRKRAADTTPTVRPVAAVPDPPTEPARANRDRKPAARRQGSGDRVLILVSVQLRDRLRAVAQAKGKTYLDLVLDAVEATVDDLPDLIATASGTQTVNTGLFERTVSKPSAPAEGKVQVTIRGVSPQNRDVLEDLVQRTNAPSLTALLVAALEAHLPERPRALRG